MLAFMSASSTLIVFFRELRAASLESESVNGVLDYLRDNPESALAQMVDEKFQQEKLRHLATRLLSSFARKSDWDCDSGRLFTREMLAMQVLNLAATSCSTSSYINWYIVETFKEVREQGTILSNDSRAKEAEEAMAQAVAEAAEMTRLLELEKGQHALEELQGGDIPTPLLHEPPNVERVIEVSSNEVPVIEMPVIEEQLHVEPPKTTFAALLQDNYYTPPKRTNATDLPSPTHRSQLDITEQVAEKLTESPSESVSPRGFTPSTDSLSRISADEPHYETLQRASISLMDLSSEAGSGKPIRQRNALLYMITIEPHGGRVPGWVSIKQFSDFEALHEVLRRLANLAGLQGFPTELPEWKGRSYQALAEDLEAYLKTALSSKQLSDSEAMKRFFGKEITEQSLAKKKAWTPLKSVGGVKDAVMSSAEGSQKLLAAAWANTGINKKRGSMPTSKSREELSLQEGQEGVSAPPGDAEFYAPILRNESITVPGTSGTSKQGESHLQRTSTSSSLNGYSMVGDEEMTKSASSSSLSPSEPTTITEEAELETPQPKPETMEPVPNHPFQTQIPPPLPERPKNPVLKSPVQELSANDAQQILDLGFSILSEFYALTPRTWMIRKSLLNLLKSLLISNGRTYIETIRIMIQEDLIEKCLTSDDWIAGQVKTMTEAVWPSVPWPPIDDERYKIEAKALFLNKMVPETTKGLMGGAATSQALEIVFEALQEEKVAKGLLVALMCDVIRALQV
jgi:Sorting nexin C terminal/PXA domain/PX domain